MSAFEFSPIPIAIAMSGVPDMLPGVLSAPYPWLLLVYIVPLAGLALTNSRTAHVVGHTVLWLVMIGAQFVY